MDSKRSSPEPPLPINPLAPTPVEYRQVRVVPQEGEGELDEAGQMEARHALQRLEAAAASVLREISSHPKLVGLLMRRRPLFALVTLSWKGQSVKAEDWAAEATLNVCAAYRRCAKTRLESDVCARGETLRDRRWWRCGGC